MPPAASPRRLGNYYVQHGSLGSLPRSTRERWRCPPGGLDPPKRSAPSPITNRNKKTLLRSPERGLSDFFDWLRLASRCCESPVAAPTRQARGFFFYALPQTRGYTGFLYAPPARGTISQCYETTPTLPSVSCTSCKFAQFYVVSRTKRSYRTRAMIASFHQKSNLRRRQVLSQ